MISTELKEQILTFMRANKLTVISTIDSNSNKPESAVIAFAEKESLELIFGTLNKSRKCANLQNNPCVSFVIGWSFDLGTIQYEGVAKELSGEVALEHGRILAEKNERAQKFLTMEDQRYFLVKPVWLRYTDKTKKPQEVIEVDF